MLNKGDRNANPESPYFLAVANKTLIAGNRTNWTDQTVSYDLSIKGVDPKPWHHVAASFQASTRTLKLYLDGVWVAQGNVAAKSIGNTLPVEIGRNGAATGRIWVGKLDDVRIWNVARTAADISANYKSELTGNQPGLVANWRFNEGTGSRAADSAGSHMATLNGGAVFSSEVHP